MQVGRREPFSGFFSTQNDAHHQEQPGQPGLFPEPLHGRKFRSRTTWWALAMPIIIKNNLGSLNRSPTRFLAWFLIQDDVVCFGHAQHHPEQPGHE